MLLEPGTDTSSMVIVSYNEIDSIFIFLVKSVIKSDWLIVARESTWPIRFIRTILISFCTFFLSKLI